MNRAVFAALTRPRPSVRSFAPAAFFQRAYSSTPTPRGVKSAEHRWVTLISGDGIGPEVTRAVVAVFAALKIPINWESYQLRDPISEPNTKDRIPVEVKQSMLKNGYCIKGPLFTPQGSGFRSPDIMLAQEFGLFAHVVPLKTLPGIKTRHGPLDMVVVRENTEGEYSGLEHEVATGVVQSLKVITREGSRKIAEYAFKYATEHGRKKVSAVHKANIMKRADGLFLECCREAAGKNPHIQYNEVIIDNCCMQLVTKPEQFDVIVTGNLYGNIVSQAAAGLCGGVGLIAGFNEGTKGVRVYEQGPRHVGMDLVNKNKANPTGFLLSSCLMLEDMGMPEPATVIRKAIEKLNAEQNPAVLTPDVDGCNGTTSGYTQAIIDTALAMLGAPSARK